MKRKLAAKIIAALGMTILWGSYVNHDWQTWKQRGETEYLSHEAHLFEKCVATLQSTHSMLIQSALIVLGALIVYEGIAWLLSKILGTKSSGRL